jgi:DNA-binding transcriptional LysR family regulator
MELWQLRTFTTVAKNLHFTRAAEELNLSQPAVSHQIKLLETEIGEPLFLREKEGILLTKAGQTMYEHAAKILDIADEMRLEIKDNEDALSGKIKLGVVTRGLGNPFPLLYREFKKKYRDINIAFQSEYKLEDIVEKVRTGSIDIGLVTHEPDLSGLVVMPYGEYEILLVVGKNHRLANKSEVTLEDLQDQDWVTFEAGNRLRLSSRDYAAKVGIVPKTVYDTNDGSVVRTMVAYDNKISLLPEWGVFEELQEGKIVAIKVKDFRYIIPINLIWKASRRTKTMSAVLTYLLESKMEGIKLTSEKDSITV